MYTNPEPLRRGDQISIKDLPITGEKIRVRASIEFVIKFVSDFYHSYTSAFREQYINALSHGCIPVHRNGEQCHVEIDFDFAKRRVSITDVNGQGITKSVMRDIVAELGVSGNNDGTRAGQHGVGLYSFLKFSSTAKIETWNKIDEECTIWLNRDGIEFQELVDEPKTLKKHGTKITLTIKDGVNMQELFESIENGVSGFPIKTFVTLNNTESITPAETRLCRRNKPSDSTIEYGGLDIGEIAVAQTNLSCPFVKLDHDDFEIGLLLSESTGYGNDVHGYLCHVPIKLSGLDTLPLPCAINIKDEEKYKPTRDRDKLIIPSELSDAIRSAITEWLIQNVVVHTTDEWISSDMREVLSNGRVREYLDEQTQKIIYKMAISVYKLKSHEEQTGKKIARERVTVGSVLLGLGSGKQFCYMTKLRKDYGRMLQDAGYEILEIQEPSGGSPVQDGLNELTSRIDTAKEVKKKLKLQLSRSEQTSVKTYCSYDLQPLEIKVKQLNKKYVHIKSLQHKDLRYMINYNYLNTEGYGNTFYYLENLSQQDTKPTWIIFSKLNNKALSMVQTENEFMKNIENTEVRYSNKAMTLGEALTHFEDKEVCFQTDKIKHTEIKEQPIKYSDSLELENCIVVPCSRELIEGLFIYLKIKNKKPVYMKNYQIIRRMIRDAGIYCFEEAIKEVSENRLRNYLTIQYAEKLLTIKDKKLMRLMTEYYVEMGEQINYNWEYADNFILNFDDILNALKKLTDAGENVDEKTIEKFEKYLIKILDLPEYKSYTPNNNLSILGVNDNKLEKILKSNKINYTKTEKGFNVILDSLKGKLEISRYQQSSDDFINAMMKSENNINIDSITPLQNGKINIMISVSDV